MKKQTNLTPKTPPTDSEPQVFTSTFVSDRKKKPFVLIILVAVLILSLLTIILWRHNHNKSKDRNTSSGNNTSQGSNQSKNPIKVPDLSKSKEGTVKFSANQEIQLSQSRPDLLSAAAGSLLQVDTNLYQYPVKATGPREAIILLDQDRVVAIRLTANPGNKDLQTGAHLGMATTEFETQQAGKFEPLDQRLHSVRLKGYIIKQENSTAYYLVDPCSNTDHIVAIVVAIKGYEEALTGNGAGCNVRGN